MDQVDAREWGRRQAARSPQWSEAKWRRVSLILGVRFLPEADEDAAGIAPVTIDMEATGARIQDAANLRDAA
ncbi:hypothetical protein [Parafrankia sp. EUN1f]|uniref:hypothetical protein n=1 Tax=Parafrankia sp. EUN1f TaxID=102897 RepID=UPI0001C45F09|nr:hypothetical protein [Parafrankia sp. EUN1f]EFC81785.1 hypothetical protein FrEUN1fDRAFT_5108 [Parafrankia sp. EUN1f]